MLEQLKVSEKSFDRKLQTPKPVDFKCKGWLSISTLLNYETSNLIPNTKLIIFKVIQKNIDSQMTLKMC